MLMPARASSREVLAPLEQAFTSAQLDYSQITSVSIIDLDDAAWGASLFIERQLAKEKTAEPHVHLVVDESGQARRALGLEKGVVHVMVYNRNRKVLRHYQGKLSEHQVQQIMDDINRGLRHSDNDAVRGITDS